MKLWIFAGAALLIAGSAFAQPADGGGGGAVRQACQPEIEKLCAGIQPGGGRIMQCIRQHRAEVSDTCRSAMRSARANHGAQGAPPPDGAPPPEGSNAPQPQN